MEKNNNSKEQSRNPWKADLKNNAKNVNKLINDTENDANKINNFYIILTVCLISFGLLCIFRN